MTNAHIQVSVNGEGVKWKRTNFFLVLEVILLEHFLFADAGVVLPLVIPIHRLKQADLVSDAGEHFQKLRVLLFGDGYHLGVDDRELVAVRVPVSLELDDIFLHLRQ